MFPESVTKNPTSSERYRFVSCIDSISINHCFMICSHSVIICLLTYSMHVFSAELFYSVEAPDIVGKNCLNPWNEDCLISGVHIISIRISDRTHYLFLFFRKIWYIESLSLLQDTRWTLPLLFFFYITNFYWGIIDPSNQVIMNNTTCFPQS